MNSFLLSDSDLGLISRDLLAGVLFIAEDAVISVDPQHRIVLFNLGAEKIFQWKASEVLGKPLDLLIPNRYRAAHVGMIEGFARQPDSARKMAERREIFGLRKDGSEFPAEASISKLAYEGGFLFTAMLRDITERKANETRIRKLNEELEERVRERTLALEEALGNLRRRTEEVQGMTQQLWQTAKLATVGELAASIAHELNNPLATVSLRIEAVLAQTTTDDPRRRALEIIDQEIERMGSLVANLLQFSRRGQQRVSSVDIREELERSIELIQYHFRHRHIEVIQQLPPALPTIYADRQQLRQLFLNLLTNAVDAMPNGGRLTLCARLTTLSDNRNGIAIEFRDTGFGIPAEYLDKVMEPFFTTKAEGKGTGLGLAICRRAVQEHNGRIRIESEVGKGTTVIVELPIGNEANVDHFRNP